MIGSKLLLCPESAGAERRGKMVHHKAAWHRRVTCRLLLTHATTAWQDHVLGKPGLKRFRKIPDIFFLQG